MNDVPLGFTPLFRTSPFLEVAGPFYQRYEADTLIIGVRIAAHHTNARGRAHGGLLTTMADIALGYNVAFLGREKTPGAVPTSSLTTVHLSVDFAGSARLGDWLEARVDIQKLDTDWHLRTHISRLDVCMCKTVVRVLTTSPRLRPV